MPEFTLNTSARLDKFKLDEFTLGYIEAMFFTNCDCGTDDEDLANRLGVRRLKNASIAQIARDCEAFQKANEQALMAATELEPGTESFRYAREPLDDTRLGQLFWFARQGHGVAFTDDGDSHWLERLQNAARDFGESCVEIYRGWIHVN